MNSGNTRNEESGKGSAGHWTFWIGRLYRAVHTDLERGMAAHGATVSQWHILSALYQEAADTVRGLSAQAGLDPGAVTRLTDRLVRKGLVQRVTDRRDARSVRIRLTPEGRALVPVLAGVAEQNERLFFSRLKQEEKENFRYLVNKLLTHALRDKA